MARVILICGRICSGKTHYCRKLKEEGRAVLLSCDELTAALFDNALGEHHDRMLRRIKDYLHRKAAETVLAGADVILDWGFWSRAEREEASAFYAAAGVPYEWHYVEVSDSGWRQNIRARNCGGNGGYAADEGLLAKMSSLFDPPAPDEIDVWVKNRR